MKVLVADDDPISRALLSHRLAASGFDCQQAADGAAAWRLAQAPDSPRLILLDWMMPGMDGVEVCRKIRTAKLEPYAYIVLVTGRDDPQDVLDGLSAGADDYIRKPFDFAEVEMRLRAGKRVLDLQSRLIAAREELRREANTDPLTGLLNRRAMMGRLGPEADRARRKGNPIAAIMVDVDHFKRVNDQHGHAAGDKVLKAVAHRLAGGVRPYDLLARFGGEEFLAFVSSASPADTLLIAERLRQTVCSTPVPLSDGHSISVSCSLGLAHSHGQDDILDATRLIGRADAALYRAKAQGRNRVEVAGDEITADTAGPHPPGLGLRGQAGTSRPPPPPREQPAGEAATDRSTGQASAPAAPSLDTIFDLLSQVVWTAGADGAVLSVSRYWTTYTGISRAATQGGGWTLAVHPGDLKSIATELEKKRAAGEPYRAEMRIKRAQDGVFRWNLICAVPLKDAGGKVLQWVGTTTDIHESKENEKRAHRLNDALRTIMEHTPVGLWSIASDGIFTTVEGTAIASLGDGWQPVAGTHYRDLPGLSDLDRGRIERALAGQRLSFTHRTGDKHFAVYYANSPTGVVAVALETTERLKSEQLREAARSAQQIARVKSDFLARMSHEIRTPMNGILGMVNLLLDTHLSDDQQEFARTIRACGASLTAIANEIPEFSMLEEQTPPGDRLPPRPRQPEAKAAVGRTAGDLAHRGAAPLAARRVLVAEDNAVNQAVVKALLGKLGVAVLLVENGQEALSALAGGGIDLVLMDCQMPTMDGLEATRLWRQQEAVVGGRVPILALTASALPADVIRCSQAGMDGFLAKPIDLAELIRLVNQVCIACRPSPS